jgi:hypothetical protein
MTKDEFYSALTEDKQIYYPEKDILFYMYKNKIYIFKEKSKITLGLMDESVDWPWDKMIIK